MDDALLSPPISTRVPGAVTAGLGILDSAELLALFRATPRPYLVLTPDLTIVEVNDAYLSATMTSRETLIGQHLFDAFPDNPTDSQANGVSRLRASLLKVLEHGVPHEMPIQRYDIRRPKRLGGGFEVRYWKPLNTPVLDVGGRVVLIIHYVEDVTCTVELQQGMDRAISESEAQRREILALKEADALKDQFLSIISHELRTPINGITGFGSILDDEIAGPLNEDQHHYLQKMLQSADTLLSLIDDLLDMSRIEAGKFQLSPCTLTFHEVVEPLMEPLGILARQKNLTLINEVPIDAPELVADPQRLRQVLTNLIQNAIKFTPEGGAIRVRCQVAGSHLRCDVSDSGVGIAQADLPKLFQRFSQLDMSSTRKVGGAGLGLSICKALVEAHGGTIGVDSTVGKGSTFWFSLPLNRGA